MGELSEKSGALGAVGHGASEPRASGPAMRPLAESVPRWAPLTHTVLLVPVEFVPRMALALVVTHCVHTDLLTAAIVVTALIGVCGTKRFPVTAAHH